MKQNIVKTEILWCRQCNLRCSYCAMPYKNGILKKNWELWKKGLANLKENGNQFCAVYGAEPLMDMDHLPDLFTELKKLDMYHTIITNCALKDTKERLTECQKRGLDSITVSFDGIDNPNHDKSSSVKSSKALDILEWFGSTFSYRDLSVVFTLTKTNITRLPFWIEHFAKKGIFVFFDLIHNDIGNPGTKCRNYDGIDSLLFTMDDKQMLIELGYKIKELKKRLNIRPYIHQSDVFLDILINKPEMYILKQWNCAFEKEFPAWLTIDYDGIVRVCDDFHLKDVPQMYFWDLDYKKLKDQWTSLTQNQCKGCFWNTHYDATMIKRGVVNINDYLNNRL